MGKIVEFNPPQTPPDFTDTDQGATTQTVEYSLLAPSNISDPIVFKDSNGLEFSWVPAELVYKDENGILDYIVGSSPDTLVTSGRVARYKRTFPIASDVFRAEEGRLKHWTVLDEAPRSPAEFLSGEIHFGISGTVSGVEDLPQGVQKAINLGSIFLPQPTVQDLSGNQIDGFYEVVGNQLFIWIDAGFLTEAVYPVTIDPTITTSSAGINGFRRLIMLSNNWLVVASGTSTVTFYVSKDLGNTWSQLCFASGVADGGTLCAKDAGTTIYYATPLSTTSIRVLRFDVNTVLNQELNVAGNYTDVDTGQTAVATPAMAYDSVNSKFWLTWASKNATYPNCYNIRASSSPDGLTWDAPVQLTGYNSVAYDCETPCIAVKNGTPLIVYRNKGYSNAIYPFYLGCASYSGGTWTNNPGAVSLGGTAGNNVFDILVRKNGSNIGRVCVVANYNNSSSSGTNLFYSDDGGTTWQTLQIYYDASGWPFSGISMSEDHTGAIYFYGVNNSTTLVVDKIADGSNAVSSISTGAPTSTNFAPKPMPLEQANMIGYVGIFGAPYYLDFIVNVLFNTIPNPPTNLSNHSFDTTLDSPPFTWTFNDSDSLSYQTAFQILITRVSDGVVVKDTGKVISGTSSYILLAGTLTNENGYQWQVNTWDNWGAMGTYSSLISFYAVTPPTAAFIYPDSDSFVCSATKITPQWSFSDLSGFNQKTYQLQLTDISDNVLWDSGVVTDANARMMTVGYTLDNLTDYKLKLTASDAVDVSSSQIVRLFSTNFTLPNKPILSLSPDVGCVKIEVTNPTPVSPTPDVGGNDIYRRELGSASWIRIAANVLGTYRDYAVASGQVYEYKVTALGVTDTTIDSDNYQGSITMRGIWLHDITDPVGTIYNFRIGGNDRGEDWQPEATLNKFAGRKLAMAEFGETEERKITAKLQMKTKDVDYAALQSLIKRKATLCYRDSRGRKMFGVVLALPITDENYGYSTSIEVNETSYSEVV